MVPAADPSDAEARHRLEDAAPAVFFHVEFQIIDNPRGDPSGAEFAAGEFGLVDDQHVESAASQFACAGRSRRAPADDDHVRIVA